MSYEFTADEIRETVNAARIYSPGYTEEEFRTSTELVKRLPESGYLRAVDSVAKLEKEKGIHCTETLAACQELSQEKVELEQKVADAKATQKTVDDEVKQVEDRLHQLEEATKQAKLERQKEEGELVAFRKRAEKEMRCIETELEQCRQQANVS